LHLVGRELLALAAAAEHDAALGVALGDLAPDARAVDRVVDRLLGIGAEVGHVVAVVLQDGDEVLLQAEARVVGADGDPHGRSASATRQCRKAWPARDG
jgi:hypothetical protein